MTKFLMHIRFANMAKIYTCTSIYQAMLNRFLPIFSPYDINLRADDRSGPLYSRRRKFFQSTYRYVHLKGAELLRTVAISK